MTQDLPACRFRRLPLLLSLILLPLLLTNGVAQSPAPVSDLTRPATSEQAAAQVQPELKLFIRQVAVDSASGNIAVLLNLQGVDDIVLYSRDGHLINQFHCIPGAQRIGWLTDSSLIISAGFPQRNQAPYIYSKEGKQIGRLGEKSNVLQLFQHKGKTLGNQISTGSILVDKNRMVYMTAPMADEDSVPLAEVDPTPEKRYDRGIGARVHVYDEKGQLVRTIGNGWGVAPGQMKQPKVMSFNEDCSLIAVENQNGIDVFDVASGTHKKTIKGFQILAQSTAPFLVVRLPGENVGQIDFEGKVIKTYPSIPLSDPLQNYLRLAFGAASSDGTLFLPGGIGYTYFRKYSPEGQLAMCRGKEFDFLSIKVPKITLARGQPLPLEIEATDGTLYYAKEPSPQPAFRIWLKSLIGDAPWRSVSLRRANADKANIDGKDSQYLVDVPSDAVGPQALRVSATDIVSDKNPEIQFLIPSGAKGSVTLFTQQNRKNYEAGEEISAHLVVQSIDVIDADIPVALIDSQTGKTVVSGQVHVLTADSSTPCSVHLTLPPSSTELLPPGDYVLTAKVDGLESYPVPLSIISPVRTVKAYMPLIQDWDTMPDGTWKYPNLGEYSSWLGFNTVVKWRHPGDVILSTYSVPTIAKSLSLDIGYPISDIGYKPNEWAEFLNCGLQTGMGLMPAIGTWEEYRVVRDDETLSQDGQKIHVMAQSLGLYPGFKGLDYNLTNFFNFDVPVGVSLADRVKTATNLDLPDNEEIKAISRGESKKDFSVPLMALFNLKTEIYARDYSSWRKALHDIKPKALGMGTIVNAQPHSWPPAIEGYLDMTQTYMQTEQIQPVYNIMVEGFWAGRPGKPNVSDYENFNEIGTGERMGSEVALSMLTGSWPGVSAPTVAGEGDVDKSTNTLRGAPYVNREFFRRQAIITDLLTTDRVAAPMGILITKNQTGLESRILGFGTGPTVWKRFYSACVLSQMAHRPARALFGDDLVAGKIPKGMKAILLVGQTVPLTKEEAAGLSAFQAKGGVVILDADCTVDIPSAIKMSVSTFALAEFSFGGKHPLFAQDGSWMTIPEILLARLPQFTAELDKILPLTVYPDRPEVFMTAYDGGDASYLAIVNSRRLPITGMDYAKIAPRFASVMPLVSKVKVPEGTKFVYDVLSRAYLPVENGSVIIDLRSFANAVLACLPVKPRIKVNLPARVKSGEKLTCTVQATDEKNLPFKAAVPFIVDLRSQDGRLLARRISCTSNAGTSELEIAVPAEISGVTASAVCAIGGETDTAQSIVTAGVQPQLVQESVLSSNVSHLLESLKMAESIVLASKGDPALDRAVTERLAAVGLKVQPPATTPIPMDKRRIVIVTGGKELDLFLQGKSRADIFPVTLSGNVPGLKNAFIGLAVSPSKPREDMLVVAAPDKTGQERLVAALDNILGGKSASVAVPLTPTSAVLPVPEKPGVPDSALSRFRAEMLAERSLSPKADWESRLKPAVARIGSLVLSSDGKTLFAGALNWDSNLYALDASTGASRWTRHAGQGYVPHVWAGANGAVLARISTTDDASHQAELFDGQGNPQRRFATPGVMVMPNGKFYRWGNTAVGWSVAVSPDGRTILGAANIGVAAWDAETGKELWHKDTYQDISEVGLQPAERIAISPDGKKVAIFYCVDERNGMIRFSPRLEVCDLSSGRLLWEYRPEDFDNVAAITPVWSSDSSTLVIGNERSAWELKTGKVVRQFAGWPGTYRPASQELFDGQKLLDARGEAKWDVDLLGRPIAWVWSPSGNEVAISTDLGGLDCYDKDGKFLWRSQTLGAAALAINNGELYAGDWSGIVYCYDLHTGQEKWRSDLGTVRVAAAPIGDKDYSAPPNVPLFSYWPNPPEPSRPPGENIAKADRGASIKLCGQAGWGSSGRVQIDPRSLIGAVPVEEALPWQSPEETWAQLVFKIAPRAEITFKTPATITGLTVHENPLHPEAFPRLVSVDAQVDGKWQRVWQGLLKPRAEHNHVFEKPVLADAIRYTPIGSTLNGVYAQTIEVLAQP